MPVAFRKSEKAPCPLNTSHLHTVGCSLYTDNMTYGVRHSRQWITFQWIQNDSARFSSDRRTQIAGCGIQAVAIDSASATAHNDEVSDQHGPGVEPSNWQAAFATLLSSGQVRWGSRVRVMWEGCGGRVRARGEARLRGAALTPAFRAVTVQRGGTAQRAMVPRRLHC